jgi:hypothetical protein
MTQISLSLPSILGTLAALSSIFGGYLKIRRSIKDRQEAKVLEKALIIQEAKEFSNEHKLLLEAKLIALEAEMLAKMETLSQKITNIDESVNKDLEHIKEAYNSEIRFLGSKIEELKDEMRTSLGQVVMLVSKLIDKD